MPSISNCSRRLKFRRYQYSIYKLPLPFLRFVAVASAVVAAVFLAGVSLELGWVLAIILGWMVLAYPAYRYRVRSLREKRGVDLDRRMKSLHDYEEARVESGPRDGWTDETNSIPDEPSSPSTED